MFLALLSTLVAILSLASLLAPVNPVINPFVELPYLFPILHAVLICVLLRQWRLYLALIQVVLLIWHLVYIWTDVAGIVFGYDNPFYLEQPEGTPVPVTVKVASTSTLPPQFICGDPNGSAGCKELAERKLELNGSSVTLKTLQDSAGRQFVAGVIDISAVVKGLDSESARILLRRLAVTIRSVNLPVAVVFVSGDRTATSYWSLRFFLRAARLQIRPPISISEALTGDMGAYLIMGRGVAPEISSN